MNFFSRGILGLIGLICLAAGACLFTGRLTEAQTLPPDVGMVTQLSGEVTYRSDGYQKTVEKAKVFMKIRQGDYFELKTGALVQLVYFQNGRKETWKGPATFEVSRVQSQAEGQKGMSAQPEVMMLPTSASQGMRGLPVMLRRAGLSRSCAMQIRGVGEVPRKKPVNREEERAEIAAAKEIYQSLRQQTMADDITPELSLLGVLANYEQYEEIEKVIENALERQPNNEVLKELGKWVQTQKTPPSKK
jgi:hypothetical protein